MKNNIWKDILLLVRKDEVDTAILDSFILKTRQIMLNENVLMIEVESDFIRQKLNEKYTQKFLDALKEILKIEDVKIKYLVAEKGMFEDNKELLNEILKEQPKKVVQNEVYTQLTFEKSLIDTSNYKEDDLEKLQREHEQSLEKRVSSSGLSSRYTFETFVVGKTNQFAYSVSVNVSKNPGKKYNPLFIHGGVGVGKTHLMQAIGHSVLKTIKKAKVLYVSGDSFLNEMVTAMQNNKIQSFREKFRNVDVLLVDDIQFIAGKVATQEEFFHTFNQLHQNSKQIVLTADKPPQEIKDLEARLVSRFESGMLVDIQPPDLELRMAILQKARDESGKKISNELIAYIAQKIEGNIRRLEGAFLKVIAYSENMNREITQGLIDEVLSDMSQNKVKKITIDTIINVVASHYKLNVSDFKAKKRSANIAIPRQIAMYLSRQLLDESVTKIGNEFGGRDHSTVLHAIQKVEYMMDKDISFKNEIEQLIKKIKFD